MSKLTDRLTEPSSFAGFSNLALLGILIPSILGQGETLGNAAAAGAQTGIETGLAAAQSGQSTVVAVSLGLFAGLTAALGIARGERGAR